MPSKDIADDEVSVPPTGRPAFIITIDTEGDDLWSKPTDIKVRNAEALPRFQELCQRYGLKPTYLVNWEMVQSASFVDFGKAVLAQGKAEIGMHLHAWNSPPLASLTGDDYGHQPYLMEYPDDIMREKVKVMTDSLESAFEVKMLSHRAGRWGLDRRYAQVLTEAGYLVDCSVTPHVDWGRHKGNPEGSGGTDYTRFPEAAYFMDPSDLSRPGASPLLQVPMTVMSCHDEPWARALRASVGRVPYAKRPVHRHLPAFSWLRPNGRNSAELLRILRVAEARGRDYVEFMLHSSEFMAGGSPTFRTEADIEALYEGLEALFDASTRHWTGHTLSEYRDRYQQSAAVVPSRDPS